MRSFDLVANTISIQFQYAADSITASRRIFMKPPKPDYECEIIYEPELTRSYNVGKSKNIINTVADTAIIRLTSSDLPMPVQSGRH